MRSYNHKEQFLRAHAQVPDCKYILISWWKHCDSDRHRRFATHDRM